MLTRFNYELQLIIFINTMEVLLTATWWCRFSFLKVQLFCASICMFGCDGREAMQLGGWRGFSVSFYVIRELIAFCPSLQFHIPECPSVSWRWRKWLHTSFCCLDTFCFPLPLSWQKISLEDVSPEEGMLTRDLYLVSCTHTCTQKKRKTKDHHQKPSQIQMIKGMSSWPNFGWVSL